MRCCYETLQLGGQIRYEGISGNARATKSLLFSLPPLLVLCEYPGVQIFLDNDDQNM